MVSGWGKCELSRSVTKLSSTAKYFISFLSNSSKSNRNLFLLASKISVHKFYGNVVIRQEQRNLKFVS